VDARPEISVLFGTYNRYEALRRCVESIREDLAGHHYEIVIADGGSTDNSREWLSAQPDVVIVGLRHLGGAVEAFNLAYAASRGAFLATFNDDVVSKGRAIHHGIEFLRERPQLGQVVLLWQRTRLEEPKVEYIRSQMPYANYGVARRSAVEAVAKIQGGIWNPCYRTYGADCELSAWMYALGLGVGAIHDAKLGYVEDYELPDALRQENHRMGRAAADGVLFWKRWSQPDAMFAGELPPTRMTEEELYRLYGGALDWSEVLRKSVRNVYSMRGEDGLFERIFDAIGTTSKVLVTLGSDLSSTRHLIEQGWDEFWPRATPSPRTEVHPLVPKEFDLLVLDADIEYLSALFLSGYRPRVIMTTCDLDPLHDYVQLYAHEGRRFFVRSDTLKRPVLLQRTL
jgi:glycosyltransferase involved in cell wall biosynthesis